MQYATGDDYVLNGTKVLVLDATVADTFIVIARTAGDAGDEQGLSAFLVDAGSDGVTIERRSLVDSRNVGRSPWIMCAYRLPVCWVSRERPGIGLTRSLDIANIGLASELLGLSTEAFERTVDYLKERRQFGRVIGSFQGLQHRAAELFAELELARSIVLQGTACHRRWRTAVVTAGQCRQGQAVRSGPARYQ